MLAHLPGRMSQPSRKGIHPISLYCGALFIKTAKRLSITSLTRLLRLHTKKKNTIQYCKAHSSKVLTTKQCSSYTTCDFATNKNGKEIRSITNNTKLSVWLTNFRPHSKWRHKKKITDWITSQKPISWRHPITLNNNITDISQKKRSAYKR